MSSRGAPFVIRLNNHLQRIGRLPALSWVESSIGPANALLWTMECKLDGEIIGIGSAKSKGAAKEAAALQALQALGVV